jgi:GntR family transcriptional regulator, transcriptional repressor for pyruvate dehydrogenase complex
MTTTLPDSARAIHRDMRRRILDAYWEVGARLPGERQLATEYSVSRPVIREALSALVSDGLITISPGRGAFIAEPDGRALTGALSSFISGSGVSVRHIAEVRAVIEGAAVAGAAAHATPAHIARLTELAPAIDTGVDRVEQAIADLAFHTLLCVASGNPMLAVMHRAMAPHVLMMMLRAGRDPEHSAAEHRVIADAVRGQDPDLAVRLLETHLRESGTYFGPDFERSAHEVAAENLDLISHGLADVDSVISYASARLDDLISTDKPPTPGGSR